MIRWGVRNPTDLNAVYDEFEKTILVEKTPFLQIIKIWFNENFFKN